MTTIERIDNGVEVVITETDVARAPTQSEVAAAVESYLSDQGLAKVYIQHDDPLATGPYIWVRTGLGTLGDQYEVRYVTADGSTFQSES